MNDVNLNSLDLKLVRSSDQAPARAISSPLTESERALDQSRAASQPIEPSALREPTKAQQLEARAEAQREELDQAVTRLNDYVQNVQRDLQFEVNNDLGKTIVRVVDQSTQEVIRQFPDEVALRLAENLQQDEPLTLFNIEV